MRTLISQCVLFKYIEEERFSGYETFEFRKSTGFHLVFC